MKILDLRGKKFASIAYSKYDQNNIREKETNTAAYGTLKEGVLLLEEDAPTLFFSNTLPDNVNVYTKLSHIPKGIAKTLNVAFVNKLEDADVIVDRNQNTIFCWQPMDKVMYSKSLDMFILVESDDFRTSLKTVLLKQYGVSDFKCIHKGGMYCADGNAYDEYKAVIKNGADLVNVEAVYKKYLASLPSCSVEEMKSIYRMIACSDEQTKELGLKMLIQYSPANYPCFVSYIFKSNNASIQKLKSHSSYINFYSYCIKNLQNHYSRKMSLWSAEHYANPGSDDAALLRWIRTENIEL